MTERDGSAAGPPTPTWAVRPYGASALLVEVEDAEQALDLALLVRGSGLRCTEVVPAARTVLLDGVEARAEVEALLARWAAGARGAAPEAAGPRPVVEVPVTYDGEDLARVADLWGVDEDEVVARHTGTELVSAFCGFAPGFAYLAGLPRAWAVPRLDAPRARVPAGSVALADTWCGVYPSASPGGWLLLGTTDLPVWDEARTDQPALLAPGTRVRFVVA